MATPNIINPDVGFIRSLQKSGGDSLKKCFQCATCSVTCSHAPTDSPFPRKEMILAQWGQASALVADPDIWLCYQCNDCSVHCPRGAKPADVLGAIRQYVYRHYSFPSFMGKALATPAALPALLLLPMVVVFLMMMGFTGTSFSFLGGEIEFHNFIPQLWLEILFMAGNVLIFLFAAIGLWRFWNGMQQASGAAAKTGFVPALIETVKDILTHKNFNDCTANRARYAAHMLVFFGFLGAMATAGLAVLYQMVLSTESPIPMMNPIKWLGNLSGIAGIIGLTIIVARRVQDKEQVGAGGYADWLFVVMLYIVFITGMSTELARLAQSAVLAFSVYYVHLVVVFFLLWYAPYSKFAHMFYRSLALVHLKSIGRAARATIGQAA